VELSVGIKGLKHLENLIKKERAAGKKALTTAIKVEGFRLMRLLKKDLRKGTVAGQKLESLTYLSRMWGGAGRLRPDKPLRRSAVAVRYYVKPEPFEMRVGWTGPRLSKSWKRIMKRQQEGFVADMPRARRMLFIQRGAALTKRSKAKPYLFLKKDTVRFKTPGRMILEPFWRDQQDNARRNIRENFRRKMRGERI